MTSKESGIVSLSDPRTVTTFHINLDDFLNENLMLCLNRVEDDNFQLYVEYDELPGDCESSIIFDHNISEKQFKKLYEICTNMEND